MSQQLSSEYSQLSLSEDLYDPEKAIDDRSSEETLLFKGTDQESHPIFSYLSSFSTSWRLLFQVAFFTVSLAMLLSSLYMRLNLDTVCMIKTTYYSPVLRDIDSTLIDVRFNGTLDAPSQYRGPPGPEIDAAWDKLENVRVISITEEELVKSGFSTDSIKLPEEYGGGYMASIEINHQLHCLNFLRKASFGTYYQFRSSEWTDDPETVRIHLDHCIEMLRQNIMCRADVGVMAHSWVKDYPRPYPNFNSMHKCRNFEQILDWTYEHQIPFQPNGYSFSPMPGDMIFESPP